MTKTKQMRRKHRASKLTVLEHVEELKSRIYVFLLCFLFGSLLGYIIREQILYFLVKPLNQTLFFTSPAGGFNFNIEISLFFGFIISIPVLLYEILKFIEPTLPRKIVKQFVTIMFGSIFLSVLGIIFAYYVCLPSALYFLNKFTSPEVQSLISAGEYFSFVTRYLVGFGLLFQLPLVILLINSIKRLEIKTLLGYERWVILLSYLAASIITPTPDVFNQSLMAVPIILLYQLSILLVWIINKRNWNSLMTISKEIVRR